MKDGGTDMSKSLKIIEGILQDGSAHYTLVELSEISVIELSFLHEMIEEGIIEPKVTEPTLQFDYNALQRAKKAFRLHRDLAINLEGISLILDLLDKIKALEKELAFHRT